MFPNAQCELIHRNVFELTIAVVLSAQTTDLAVNQVTKPLFAKFPTPIDLANAPLTEIENYIKTLGLYRSKAKNIKSLSATLVEKYQGQVPDTLEKLIELDGVGRKTANVILSVWFNIPAIAVDTHVSRVSKRLRLVYQTDSVEVIERKLMRKFDKQQWSTLHHLLIFFGRYFCKAKNPNCEQCPFQAFCYDYKHIYSQKKSSH